jgi:TetR/AcrR family transcriptional regulator
LRAQSQRGNYSLTRSQEPEVVNVRRRQQRSTDTRERILQVAFQEFAERGFDGVSTRSIAALAGVQHPLVTHHFESKEGLWKAVLTTVQQNFSEYFVRYVRGEKSDDDVEELRRLQEAYVRFSAAYPNYSQLMGYTGRHPGPLLDWLVESQAKAYFQTFTKLISSAQAQGRYVAGDPVHLQYLFIGCVTRILMQAAEAERVMGRSLSAPKFVEEHVRMCCDLFFRDAPPEKKRKPRAAAASPAAVVPEAPAAKKARARR